MAKDTMDTQETQSEVQPAMQPAEMLRQDHQKVQELFQAFEETDDPQAKKEICKNVLTELKIHAALEEEIFYPAVRQELEEEDMMDEAEEEHHVAKLLIEELEGMEPEDEHFEAKFKVLGEVVKHHIQEEESEMLPKAEQSDISEIGEEMMERKRELTEEMGQSSTRKGRSKSRKSPSSRRSGTRSKKR